VPGRKTTWHFHIYKMQRRSHHENILQSSYRQGHPQTIRRDQQGQDKPCRRSCHAATSSITYNIFCILQEGNPRRGVRTFFWTTTPPDLSFSGIPEDSSPPVRS